jgi:hypothetical protein
MIDFNSFSLFADNQDSLKNTSYDEDNDEYMTNIDLPVINFDKVTISYQKKCNLSACPCSNDALYITENGLIVFIEFKNGTLDQKKAFELQYKIYDSLLTLFYIEKEKKSIPKNKLVYILVYNDEKNSESSPSEQNSYDRKTQIQSSPAKDAIGKILASKANSHFIKFGLEKIGKLYFKEIFTWSKKEFEKEFKEKYFPVQT